MAESVRTGCEMRTALPATLQAAEAFCVEFRRRSEALMDRVSRFAAELLVREALTNAVVHGCRADPGKQVRIVVRLKCGRLLIAVDDDGDGFDWRGARGRSAALSDSGRGLEILRTYASRVHYNSRGNSVTMIKRLS